MTDREKAALAVRELARAWRAAHSALMALPAEDRSSVALLELRDPEDAQPRAWVEVLICPMV